VFTGEAQPAKGGRRHVLVTSLSRSRAAANSISIPLIPFEQRHRHQSPTINLCTINVTIALRLPLGKKISTHTTSHVSASRSRPRCSADRGSDLERDPDHSALGSPPHCTPKPSHPTSQRCRLHTTHRGISTSRRSGCRSTPGGPTSDP
jgi:hypothetical protein